MKTAVISLTGNGRLLSRRIAENAGFISTERYCFHSHSDNNAHSFNSLSDTVADIFTKFDALIFVCACGIAVRSIAPHLNSKSSDPAVVVIDNCGKYVVPILSGHIGGANALAERLAEVLGAQAIITTATDTGGRFSPDSFAAANSLIINDTEAAKSIASAILDGETVGIVSELEYRNLPRDISPGADCRFGLYIGSGSKKPFPVTLKLVPKNIVLGIGCKKGSDCETIENAVLTALKTVDIPIERIADIATIDIKISEKGLLGFCEKYDLKLTAYSADELINTEGDFTSSDFVKNITGVDNVCERSAVKCSNGRLLLRKTAVDGVTVAAAEKTIILDFERRML